MEKKMSSITHNDQDNDVSFEHDTNKKIDTTVIEEEDLIEYIKRSTNEAIEKMENAKIRCWNKTHKRRKWRLALRMATSPNEKWLMKAAEWNPELSSKHKMRPERLGDQEKDGKTTSTNSSNLKKTRHKTALKAEAKAKRSLARTQFGQTKLGQNQVGPNEVGPDKLWPDHV